MRAASVRAPVSRDYAEEDALKKVSRIVSPEIIGTYLWAQWPDTRLYKNCRDLPSTLAVAAAMVQLLLEYGADPNQKVYPNDGRTIWELFLLSSTSQYRERKCCYRGDPPGCR